MRTKMAIAASIVAATLASCSRTPPTADPSPSPAATATTAAPPLASLLAQQILFAPAQRARIAPDLRWTALPPPADLTAAFDSALAKVFRDRDAARNWVFAEALVRSYTRNSTYGTDPRVLSVEPLRAAVEVGTRLPEPLATQLRTMIALQSGRLVLIPVELRLESVAGGGEGRGAVRLVLVDPRASDVRWVADIKGEPASAYGPGVAASVAARIANLFAAP